MVSGVSFTWLGRRGFGKQTGYEIRTLDFTERYCSQREYRSLLLKVYSIVEAARDVADSTTCHVSDLVLQNVMNFVTSRT